MLKNVRIATPWGRLPMLSANRIRRLLTNGAILASLTLSHFAPAPAQDSSSSSPIASLTVVVTDVNDAVIPGAEVTLRGEKSLTTKTGPDGSVQIPLSFGSYAVTIARVGFKTTKIDGFPVQVTNPPVLKVVLQVGQIQERTDCMSCVEKIETIPVPDLPIVIEKREYLVYMRYFGACSTDKPCTQSKKFRVASIPAGCCTLSVTNGTGHGTDEVKSYEIFLNGKRVLPQAQVEIRRQNTLKVVLVGEPSSKVFIRFAYDPRQTK
jgi:hypothetical protein